MTTSGIYSSIPQLSPEQLNTPQMATIEALKQNMELLIGDADKGNSAAVIRSAITVSPITTRNLEAMSASGTGYALQGVNLASAEDHRNLITDVAKLASDVADVINVLNQLIADMKGTQV